MQNDKKRHVDIVECAKRGWTDRVKYLIASGDDVNEQDKDGNCAIVFAARNNDLAMMKMLVEAGASLNVREPGGATLLGWAHYNRSQDMVMYIKQHNSIKQSDPK